MVLYINDVYISASLFIKLCYLCMIFATTKLNIVSHISLLHIPHRECSMQLKHFSNRKTRRTWWNSGWDPHRTRLKFDVPWTNRLMKWKIFSHKKILCSCKLVLIDSFCIAEKFEQSYRYKYVRTLWLCLFNTFLLHFVIELLPWF